MSSEMKKLRKEDLSLYYYIKDIVFMDYVEQETSIALNYMEEVSYPPDSSYVYTAISTMLPKPTDRGRGWMYFDENDLTDQCLRNTPTYSGTPEQDNRVTVYSGTVGNLTVLSGTEYILDYIDGRVITSGTVTPTYVDYYWNYVSVVDEWAAIEAADPPVVVIDVHGTDKTGYQLGGGKKEARKVDIHIFASSTAERNDIAETLYDAFYLKSIPLYDLPNGSVLDYDGTFYARKDNPDKAATPFDRTVISGVSNIYFENVVNRHVNLPLVMSRGRNEVMLSDLNAYRSKVSFDMFSYNDRVIN